MRLRDELAAAKTEAAAEASRPAEERISTLRVDPNYRLIAGNSSMFTTGTPQLQNEA